jgi:HEAT repeat protein
MIYQFEEVDIVLLLLVFSIAVLLVVSFLLAIYTIILRVHNERKQKHWEQHENQWQPIILNYLAGKLEAEEIQRNIPAHDRMFFVDYLQRFGYLLSGKENRRIAILANPLLKILAERANRGDAEQRARSIQTLSVLGFEQYSEVIIKALDDPSPLVVMIAVQALTRKDHPEHFGEVLSNLWRVDSWSPNYLSALLASVGTPAIPGLQKLMIDVEAKPRVRLVAVETLRKIRDIPSADIVAKMIDNETDVDLLSAMLRLLGSVGNVRHLSIIRRMCDHPSDVVRGQAVNALAEMGDITDHEKLTQLLIEPSPWVALHSAHCLHRLGGIDILKELAETDHENAIIAHEVLLKAGR